MGPHEAVARVELPCTPRDVLAAVMALRPRRFHLVRANASTVILKLSSGTAAGFEQGLEVRMHRTTGGTEVCVEYAGTVRAGLGSGVRHLFLSDLDRAVAARATCEPVPA